MSLAGDLGLGDRECVALVGGGGKSTIMATLASEHTGSTSRVVITTTTRIQPDEIGAPVAWTDDPDVIGDLLEPGVPLYVVIHEERGKLIGITPVAVDRLFRDTDVDLVVVEADGARRRPFKAPADHEPVIPSTATTVVVVVGIDAIGRPAEEVAHRPEVVARLTGTPPTVPLTLDDVAAVLLDDGGGLKGVPAAARVVMAVTKVGRGTEEAAATLASILEGHPRVERTVILPRRP
jgi:probable selenium-dependent hydroxylase accessory protein YqeC